MKALLILAAVIGLLVTAYVFPGAWWSFNLVWQASPSWAIVFALVVLVICACISFVVTVCIIRALDWAYRLWAGGGMNSM